MTDSHIYYGEKQMPLLLDLLEEEFPLKHRKLYIEHGENPTHTELHVCSSGHVHLEIAPTSATALVSLLAVWPRLQFLKIPGR